MSDYQFDVLIIEPIPYTAGESPRWFIKEARKGIGDNFVKGGESALAAIRANEKRIPFWGGEIDPQKLFLEMKSRGYSNSDILGFYLVRQVPQWVRERQETVGLIERNAPSYFQSLCHEFKIRSADCPDLSAIDTWYKKKMGGALNVDVSKEASAPLLDGPLFTHRISSDIGAIRDRYTLRLIEDLLKKYRRVAVVYGGSHYVTLQKSFDSSMGSPIAVISPAATK